MIKYLREFAAQDIGLYDAKSFSQFGIISDGNIAVLANISGKFNRFTMAISVSIFLTLITIIEKRDEKPIDNKEITAKTPIISKILKEFEITNPLGIIIAINNNIIDWTIAFIVDEKTFDRTIESLGIGETRSLVR